jgi:hypothetical protein
MIASELQLPPPGRPSVRRNIMAFAGCRNLPVGFRSFSVRSLLSATTPAGSFVTYSESAYGPAGRDWFDAITDGATPSTLSR